VQSRRLPVGHVHAHLDETCLGKVEAERPHAREAAVALADEPCDLTCDLHGARAEVDVEGDERSADADEHSARGGMEPRRAEVGGKLARVDSALKLLGASAAEEGGLPAVPGQPPVEEHGQLELCADPLGEGESRGPCAWLVLVLDRHEGDDVGRSDPRVGALVAAQVDPLGGATDPGEQRLDELLPAPNEREDGAVVVPVGVHVEKTRGRGHGLLELGEHAGVATFGEVRHRLERQHGASLRAVRVAVLNDIHGNLPALEAVLAELETVQPDLVVVGGDVALGPFPRETLETLLALDERVRFVRGNCDRQPGEFAGRELTADQVAFLAGLPLSLSLDVEGLGPTLFCHGSPRSDEEIVTRLSPDERLAPMTARVDEETIVTGHTHVHYDRRAVGKRWVNAGSVGMPYENEPGAYWALLGPDVEFRRSPYDLEAAVERIAASALPDAEAWAREYVYAVNGPDEASRYLEGVAAGD
jgi:putative phosphoesterase